MMLLTTALLSPNFRKSNFQLNYLQRKRVDFARKHNTQLDLRWRFVVMAAVKRAFVLKAT